MAHEDHESFRFVCYYLKSICILFLGSIVSLELLILLLGILLKIGRVFCLFLWAIRIFLLIYLSILSIVHQTVKRKIMDS